MTSSFTRRHIDVTFALGEGSFGEDGKFNTVTLSGLRVSAAISVVGLPSYATAEIRVYGLTLSQMNQLSTLGHPLPDYRLNRVTLSAGDNESGLGIVFQGTIINAWADLQNQPEAVFIVIAVTGAFEAAKPVAPRSYQGSVDVAVIMDSLAEEMNMAFENNGVSVVLHNPYFPGTAMEQVKSVAHAANIQAIPQDGVLAIWPTNGVRGGLVPLISPDTGLVGYPSYSDYGVSITKIYSPGIRFSSQIEINSSIKPACGFWTVNQITHQLESETPSGAWFTHLECYRFGTAAPIPRQ